MAARSMPELSTMEIWNWKSDEHGCMFRYYGSTESGTITWQSTWPSSISDEAIQSWTETVREKPRRSELRVLFEELSLDGLRFPASVLRQSIKTETPDYPSRTTPAD